MQKLSGELTAAGRQLELAATDLQGEKDRVASLKALVERKVRRAEVGCVEGKVRQGGVDCAKRKAQQKDRCWMWREKGDGAQPSSSHSHSPPTPTPSPPLQQRAKKRRWKAACAAADTEIQALHGQLLGRQQEIEGLEKRVENLETEVRDCLGGGGEVQGRFMQVVPRGLHQGRGNIT